MMTKIIKGYKAFDKNMTCRGFKYEEGKTYECKEAKICEKGFHFCENPLDTLDYYDLYNSVFCEVESSGKTDTHKKDTKVSTTKIKIGAKIFLSDFIKASYDFIWAKCKKKASGYSAKLAASGNSAQLAASGNSAQLAASGDLAKLAASGNYARLAASGNSAQLAASGNSAQLAASGYSAKLAASGNLAKLAASGNYAKLAASGNSAQLAASGNSAQLALEGKDSVGANIGIDGKAKGKRGCWITLAEYNNHKPICVKSVKIDGKKLKEDTWYKLKDKKFIEA